MTFDPEELNLILEALEAYEGGDTQARLTLMAMIESELWAVGEE